MSTRTPRCDASLLVKLWISASALLLFSSVVVHHTEWREFSRLVGQLSLFASVIIGVQQAQSRDADERE